MTNKDALWNKLEETISELSLHQTLDEAEITHAFDKMEHPNGKDFLLTRASVAGRKIRDINDAKNKLMAFLQE